MKHLPRHRQALNIASCAAFFVVLALVCIGGTNV